MKLYVASLKDRAREYTIEEMKQMSESYLMASTPLDDECRYWKEWITDPLTIKMYYNEEAPKFFKNKEKHPDVYYKLETLSEEQLHNLETYNHVNVDFYNRLIKEKKYDLAMSKLDEEMFPFAHKARELIMCGANEKEVINALCKAFGKSYTIDVYHKMIGKNDQPFTEGTITSKEDPLINHLTEEEINNIQVVMDQYVVDVKLGRLRAEPFNGEKEDKQFIDLHSYGYKIDNYLMYIPDVKEQKILDKHRINRKEIVHLLLTKDKSKHTVGTVVDHKHIGKIPITCVDGEKRQDLRWIRYFAFIDTNDIIKYSKVVYSLQVKDIQPYIPVLVIITCYDIDVDELLEESPELKKAIDNATYILAAPIDEVYGQNDLNYLSRMIDEMTYGTVNDVIRRLEGMKFYYFDDPNKIVDLSESDVMALSEEELAKIDGCDEETHKWISDRYYALHPAQLIEKYYDADDISVKDADYLNWYYYDRYSHEELTEEKLERLRKYNHKNVDIYNTLYKNKAKEYCDFGYLIPNQVLIEWKTRYPAYKAIVYAYPQEEIHEKLQEAFGKKVTDEVWYQYYPEEN